MRVLVLSNMYPAGDSSFGIFVKRQVEALSARGIEVRVVGRTRRSGAAYAPFLLGSLRRLLRGGHDVVHAHYGFHSALLPSIWKRRPLVITFHGSDALVEPGRGRLYARLQRHVVARADRLVAVSGGVREVLVSDLGAKPSKISVIPCGVDTSLFRPLDREAARARVGLAPDAKVAIFVGRLEARKGVDLLLRAAERLPEVRFLLVGEGALRAGPPNCRFLGAVPNARLPGWLAAADLFLLPSRSEGTPVVLLEAMACGLPVVATRVGGIPDLVRDGETGAIIEAGDLDALVDRLRRLLDDPEQAKEMGRRGEEIVAAYDQDAIAERLTVLYRQILEA